MKTLANRIVMLVAGGMVWGSMAFGQDMKANVPFAFRTASGTLPAGVYNVGHHTNNGSPIATLRNRESGKSVFLAGGINDTWKTGNSALLFRCAGSSGCTLAGIRTPSRTIEYPVYHKNPRERETAMIAIPMRVVTAD